MAAGGGMVYWKKWIRLRDAKRHTIKAFWWFKGDLISQWIPKFYLCDESNPINPQCGKISGWKKQTKKLHLNRPARCAGQQVRYSMNEANVTLHIGKDLNLCWNIVSSTIRNKLQWNVNRNWCIFIQENAFENVVCEMSAILSRPQCVKQRISGQCGMFYSVIEISQHEMR